MCKRNSSMLLYVTETLRRHQPVYGTNEATKDSKTITVCAVSYTHLDVYKRQDKEGFTAVFRATCAKCVRQVRR